MDFASFILSITVFLGITLGFFLFLVDAEKRRTNVFVGFIILFVTLFVIPPFLHKLGLLEQFPHFIRLRTIFGMAIGPLMYIYVKTCIQKDFQISTKTLLHFIPVVIAAVYAMPFIMQSGADKIQAFLDFENTGKLDDSYFMPIIKSFYNICYFFLSLQIILRYKNHVLNEASIIDEAYHRWLIFFSSFLWVPLLFITLYAITGANALSLELLYLSPFIFMISVYAFMFFKPAVFHPFPHQMQAAQLTTQEETKKYEGSNLKEKQKEKYLQKLSSYMNTEKSYREPELTLSKLSELVNIPTHHLSQIINEKFDCHFWDYINGLRIEEVKTKLVDESLGHYTIEAIAYEVGFNTKSTFYTAFKKMTKTTPSAYRRSSRKMAV